MRPIPRLHVWIGVALVGVVLGGCNQPPLADHDLCRYSRRMVGAAASGDSAPWPLVISAGQRISIQYVSEVAAGEARFVLHNDQTDLPLWTSDPLMGKANPAQTITPPVETPPGNYFILLRSQALGQHTLCWRVEVR